MGSRHIAHRHRRSPRGTPSPQASKGSPSGEEGGRGAQRMRGRHSALLAAMQGLAPSLELLPPPVGCHVPAWHMPAICSPCHSILGGPASSLLAGAGYLGAGAHPNCYIEQTARSCSECQAPVREVAYNPVSYTAKLRLREAVSCLRPHSLQGQTSPVTRSL